jgi:hypothetical protein
MNPTAILIVAALWLASVTGAFFYGSHVEALSCAAANSKADHAVVDKKDADAVKQNAPSIALEKTDAQAKVIYRTITKTVDRIVERPVYRSVCLDDDGLRAANDAIAGEAAATGQPDSAMQ